MTVLSPLQRNLRFMSSRRGCAHLAFRAGGRAGRGAALPGACEGWIPGRPLAHCAGGGRWGEGMGGHGEGEGIGLHGEKGGDRGEGGDRG